MSLLNAPTPPSPAEIEEDRRVAQLKGMRDTANKLYLIWESNFEALWKAKDPAAILAKLGTDGAEVFNLSATYVGFMTTFMAGTGAQDILDKVNARILSIQGLYEIDEVTGIVTYIPPVEEEEV